MEAHAIQLKDRVPVSGLGCARTGLPRAIRTTAGSALFPRRSLRLVTDAPRLTNDNL